MSLFPNNIFGRRRQEPPKQNHHQNWHHQSSFQNHGYGTKPTHEPSQIMNNTHIEWNETPESHVLKAHFPGLKRSDVRVEVDDDRVLCIICEKSVEIEEQRNGWHHVEFASGHFVQRIYLPENSMVDHVKAYMDNGVLTIHVPKYKVADKRVRNVQISHV